MPETYLAARSTYSALLKLDNRTRFSALVIR
jgi:hypothetical protein